MKVTVGFGEIKVIVPCIPSDITIRELEKKACEKYRKVLGKDSNYYIHIYQLESALDGGIFDDDDLVCDVAEDKEKLIARFEEEELYHQQWGSKYGRISGGNSTFAHSTFSPNHEFQTDDFQQRHLISGKKESSLSYHKKEASLEIDVDTEALRTNTTVMVRKEDQPPPDSNQRSINVAQAEHSANRNIYDPRSDSTFNSSSTPLNHHGSFGSKQASKPLMERRMNSKDQSYFRRGAVARQSKGSGLADEDTLTLPPPPTISSSSASRSDPHNENARHPSSPWFYRDSQEISFVNDGNVDAIKVGSFLDRKSNKFAGLLIQYIDGSSRTGDGGILTGGDVIVGINEHMLMDFAFEDAEAMLKESLKYSQVQLRILPVEERMRRKDPNLSAPSSSSIASTTPSRTSTGEHPSRLNSSSSSVSTQNSHSFKAVATPRQLVADTVGRYTKKIGSRIEVKLPKDVQGLGFTLTSRDTTIGGPGPIYIKQILPQGAAIKNGKLQAGDRLLEVNEESMIGKTQEEVVSLLRSIPIGSVASITISRQNENLPRKLDEQNMDGSFNEADMKEYFVFEIALNDTGSAGLGISLKGNQSTRTGRDMGVFVRKVLHGGAAWQDGRLQSNDQLIEVNGHSLRGISNQEAIDLLRTSLFTEANMRGLIEVVIARHRKSSDASTSQLSSEASSDLSDLALDQTRPIAETGFSYPSTLWRNPERRTPKRSLSFGGVPSSRVKPRPSSGKCVRLPDYPSKRKEESEPLSPSSLHSVDRRDVASSSSLSVDNDKIQSTANPDVIICDEEELQWPDEEPFSRESTTRQSISEKRRDARFPRPNIYSSKEKIQRIDHDKSAVKQGHKKEERSNGKVKSPLRSAMMTSQSLYKAQINNNNSTYAWKVPQSRGVRKSASSESLLEADKVAHQSSRATKQRTKEPNKRDVGPSLGIAKSSSLESLQTALESYKHGGSSLLPAPRPFTKVLRGRVMNDSFRAALDQTSDGPQQLQSTLEILKEAGYQSNAAPSSDDSLKNSKKRNKLFNIFKSSKPRKLEESRGSSDTDLHRRAINIKMEREFQLRKEEKEHSRVTAPSSGSSRRSSDHRTEQSDRSRRSADPLHPSSEHRSRKKDSIDPPPLPRHQKRDKEKKRDHITSHGSLPRRSRRESDEIPTNLVVKVDSTLNNKQLTLQRRENLEFYNRHKPSSVKMRGSKLPRENTSTNTELTKTPSPEKLTKNPDLTSPTNRSRSSKTKKSDKSLTQNPSTLSFYQREKSPDAPRQGFFVVQNKAGSPGDVVVRRGVVQRKQEPYFRHSIFTDQPSLHPHQYNHDNARRWQQAVRAVDDSGSDGNRAGSTPDSEVADRNRRAYCKLMHNRPLDGVVEKIEVSVPYNI